MEENKQVKMAPPWVQYASAVKAMFREDPEIRVVYINEGPRLLLYVNNQTKAEALAELLPSKPEFGSVIMPVDVIPANDHTSIRDKLRWVFNGNNAVSQVRDIEGVLSNPLTYIIFKKEVVQYFIDNLGDFYGNRNTLYQDLAAEIFPDHDGVLFCTEEDEKAAAEE